MEIENKDGVVISVPKGVMYTFLDNGWSIKDKNNKKDTKDKNE